MNWEAIGAVGEVVGAIAVLITLIVLVVQVQQNTRTIEESNRLHRADTVDRHAESIGRWRSQLINNEDATRIWLAACNEQEIGDRDAFILDNLWVNFVNTQRSNFTRAAVVNEAGMAKQASMSVAIEIHNSATFVELWAMSKKWHEFASPDFVQTVEKELQDLAQSGQSELRPSSMSGRGQRHTNNSEKNEGGDGDE